MARKRIQGGKKEEREMAGLPQRPPDGGTPLPFPHGGDIPLWKPAGGREAGLTV